MKPLSEKIKSMFHGLGIDPEDLLRIDEQPDEYLYAVTSPFASLSRYRKYIWFLDDITSMKALYKYRISVIVEYFITLSETMAEYNGVFADRKIIDRPLTEEMKASLRAIATELTTKHMAQIEAIEARSEHDTAAITDWIKFIVDQQNILKLPESDDGSILDAFHFGRTSEDVNSPVFALQNRDLFYKYIIPEIISFQEMIIAQARSYYDIVTSGLTHGQPAEPTLISKQFMNVANSIDSVLRSQFIRYDEKGEQRPISFPVKTFGAVGNHSDLHSAYPDVDWLENDRRFVAKLGPGLHLDTMTTQSSLYAEYKVIYDALCTIARIILKFARDFWGWTSLQWFKKKRRQGVKGSSVMPNKYNPWRIEGAEKILEKFVVQLEYTSKALMDYHYEGDMGRSIIMRDIADDFAKFFIGIGRIKEELQQYEVNLDKICSFLKDNPGLVGGAAQTILKRERVRGDAYRRMQQMMINPDGSYVTGQTFIDRLSKDDEIPKGVKDEIIRISEPANNIGYAKELVDGSIERVEETLSNLKRLYVI